MAYGKKSKSRNPFLILKIKLGRIMAAHFPLNALRIIGLRMCGFKVGKKVYVGSGLLLTMFNNRSDCMLEIGDRVAIAPRVTLVLASDANWSKLNKIIKPVEGKIVLENDCWLGTGVIVRSDVTIGNMSIIGAGSVVTENIPPFSIATGSPAKVVKQIS